MIHILLYHLICFTDFIPEATVRYQIGYSYVLFVIVSIAVHTAILLINSFGGIKKWWMPKHRVIMYKRELAKKEAEKKAEKEAEDKKVSTLLKLFGEVKKEIP